MNPWSSSGRKLLGTFFPKKYVPPTITRRIRKARLDLWIRCRQVLTYPSVALPNTRLNQRKKAPRGPLDSFLGRNNMADRAGLRVNALKADSATDTAMVTANC